jgi:hypothetical protein
MRRKSKGETVDAAGRDLVLARTQVNDAERLLKALRLEIASVLRVESSTTADSRRGEGLPNVG